MLGNGINFKNSEDIEVAERRYLDGGIKKKYVFFILLFSFIIFPISFYVVRKLNSSLFIENKFIEKTDGKILGHFPYKEVGKELLIEVEPNILVHREMYSSLLEMRSDAYKEGVYLVFLSGFRSIKLQNEIFYSIKSLRNQSAFERARVSAPPGFSEHSTGFAIDIGDALKRESDFEVEFENTKAFKWLKQNAAKYHFKMSFDKNHKNVDYEPWHWRYEGSIESLKIFEASNRSSKK
tara:strand:- start:5281 stop:5991 length:711 start_codon:yes stop_codon:yes gene_type:complete